MLETNIRIVYPGRNLYVWTRRATVQGTHYTPDLLEKCCGKLRYQHGIAAVKHPSQEASLLVASSLPIKAVKIEDEDWELDVVDAGEPAQKYTLSDPYGTDLLPQLIERALLVTLKSRTGLWNYDSPRFWYEPEPIARSNGFVVYQRYEVSGVYVQDVGVGIAVDIGTAFFTEATLEYFFSLDVSKEEQKQRRSKFDQLRKRHGDHQGTLLYDHGVGHSKCYFREANGTTCSNTGLVKVKGVSYSSLAAYYRAEKPSIVFSDNTPVIRVAFDNISKSQPVAANRLKLRVMNDALPRDIRDVDKIDPAERREKVLGFWDIIGSKPFGAVAPGVFFDGLWRPSKDHKILFPMPDIAYGNGHCLSGPKQETAKDYLQYYRERIEYLDECGCYFVPPGMSRTVYCVHPEQLDADINRLCNDLETHISRWTGHNVAVQPLSYTDVNDAALKLRREAQSGVVVFVLNEEENGYYEAAYQLPNWRVKRITKNVLEDHYRQLTEGVWDRKLRKKTREQGQRRWNSFVKFNGLEIIQLMDTVPYRTIQTGQYEAQVIIDVGYDRRYFALSLLVSRNRNKKPDFLLRSEPYRKPDHKRQTINPIILADEIEKLFGTLVDHFDDFDPIESALFIRDGYFYGALIDEEYKHETDGIQKVIQRLKTKGILTEDSQVDLVNLQKDTLKSIRMWEIHQDSSVTNPLEGTGFKLDDKTMVIATTGAATLRQGTALPYIVRGNSSISDIEKVGESTFMSAQLNWSSPTTAQRMLLPLKRTDEELQSRSSQEVRRYQ